MNTIATVLINSLLISSAFSFSMKTSQLEMTSQVVAGAKAKAVIQHIEMPKSKSLPANMTCFAKSWYEQEEFAQAQLEDQIQELKEQNKDAFYDFDQEDTQLQCFIVDKLNNDEKLVIEKVLNSIEKSVDSDVLLLIPSDKEESITLNNNEESFRKEFDPEDRSFLRNHDRSFLRKLGRAELIVGGVEIFGMATLLALPKSITKWEDDFLDDARRNMKRAWTSAPVWDKDEWAINYIGHPYAGAIYYNSLRSQNASMLSSFLFSTAQSFIWEYAIESVAEQPSIQDLMFTSTIGSVVGEAAHWGTLKMRKNGFNTLEKVIVTIINPSYVINNGFR